MSKGDMEDLVATLVENTKSLNECREKDDKLIEQVRKIEDYYN